MKMNSTVDPGYNQHQGNDYWCFFNIELSYIRVLKGMKLPVGAKIRIDYKPVFLMSEFLISGIHCTWGEKKTWSEWNPCLVIKFLVTA